MPEHHLSGTTRAFSTFKACFKVGIGRILVLSKNHSQRAHETFSPHKNITAEMISKRPWSVSLTVLLSTGHFDLHSNRCPTAQATRVPVHVPAIRYKRVFFMCGSLELFYC